jgi:thymidylate synthase
MIFGNKKKLPPFRSFESNDFNNAWEQVLHTIITEGKEIVFGDKNDKKNALDSVQTIVLNENAVRQIERHEIHDNFPFRSIEPYVKTFTYEFWSENYVHEDPDKRHDYLYFDRLIRKHQMTFMRRRLEEQIDNDISSNRCQAITWDIDRDANHEVTPCFQRAWIRYEGDSNVVLHLSWRSRDAYNAYQANIIALTDLFNREVIKPCGCKIIRIIDSNDSLHIYRADVDAATKLLKKLEERDKCKASG